MRCSSSTPPPAAPSRATPRPVRVDLVTLILKKRLFSSPAAFALTLESHLASEDQNRHPERSVAPADITPDIEWMDEVLAWDDEPSDDDPGSDDERTTFGRIAALPGILDDLMVTEGSPMEAAYRRQLAEWADSHAEPADSKAIALVEELNAICRPAATGPAASESSFSPSTRPPSSGSPGILPPVASAGTARPAVRRHGREEARAPEGRVPGRPDRDPIRILLATDAASEGIDLQRYCHRVIHYDIPFNPNRLEQRIGRVDRHGQAHEVEVSHFVGAGWESEPEGSYAGDLEYLSRVARKVATERQDLGSVNPVLAHAVEARMLGRPN